VLVTHHVELIISRARYVVKMNDGHIETQGTVSDLRQRGILQEIASQAEEERKGEPSSGENDVDSNDDAEKSVKVPKKLVEEEERAHGAVKWSVYVSYITAS